MTQPVIRDPDLRRRVRRVLHLALGATWLAATAITHLPGPSVSDDPATREAVRGVWVAAGETLRQLASIFRDSVFGGWVPDGAVELLRPLISDKTVHFGLWLALAVLWSSSRALGRGLTRRDGALIVAGLGLYAVLSEVAQTGMGRIADTGDVVANLFGAIAGVATVAFTQRLLGRRPAAEQTAATTVPDHA